MPCLVAQFDPAIGPILGVVITPAGVLQHHVTPVGGALPASGTPLAQVPLLVDTGADATFISPQLAAQLNLRSIGLRPVLGATSSSLQNKYLVDIGVPFPSGQPTPGAAVPAVTYVVPNVEAIEFIGGSPHFQGLLGRDILMNAHFTMSCWAKTFTICM